MRPWFGVALIMAIFGALTVASQWYSGLRLRDPEWPRKIFHIGMGLTALCAPWFFVTPWPVILLAAGFTVFMVALRASQRLKKFCGHIIHGVTRKSLGDICFPLGVGLLCLLSGGDGVLYAVPMLILSLADAAAALVGRCYGQLKYTNFGSEKSLEGSLAFLIMSSVCVFAPLFLFTEVALLRLVSISLTLSLALTLLEAASGRGLDNLVLPVASYFLLRTFLFLPLVELLTQLALELALTALFAIPCLDASWPRSSRAHADYAKWTNALGWPGGS